MLDCRGWEVVPPGAGEVFQGSMGSRGRTLGRNVLGVYTTLEVEGVVRGYAGVKHGIRIELLDEVWCKS